jgi:hypothetical protein
MALFMLSGGPMSPLRATATGLALLSAAVAVPPIVKWLRARTAILRPAFVPPVLAVLLTGVAANIAPPEVARSPDAPAASAQRPSTEQVVAQARAALESRDHETATTLLSGLPRREQTDNPLVVAAMKDASAVATASGFPFQVSEYLLPEIAALALPTEADEISAVWTLVSKFEDLARTLEDAAKLPLDDAGKAALEQARAALSRKQVALFPGLRRLWRDKAAHAFWLMDIDVAVSGERSATVTWTGAMFAANANIQEAQTGFVANAGKLRFKTARYRWFSRADRVTSYDIKPPPDTQIGYWNGGVFVAVEG